MDDPRKRFISERLRRYWNRNVSELATLDMPALSEADRQRHQIYALLVLALVHRFFNGNKRGVRGQYPMRSFQVSAYQATNSTREDQLYEGGDYLGHNIAAVAVNSDGSIADFDFNNVELFNSSLEHAEARLVRRLFESAQVKGFRWKPTLYGNDFTRMNHDQAASDRTAPPFAPPPRPTYYKVLASTTIYTSLEPCAQCIGIMALAGIPKVVYLQYDPEQHYLANILRRLGEVEDSKTGEPVKYLAPLPIDADEHLNFEYSKRLNDAYQAFTEMVGPQKPFWIDPRDDVGADEKVDASSSVASFLCTDAALGIAYQVSQRLLSDELLNEIVASGTAGFKPTYEWPITEVPLDPESVLSNADVLQHAREFLVARTTRATSGASPTYSASGRASSA